ncbi:MAG: hypothetical protein LBG58_08165 [Planctomycetaceae bacterium]|jgi:hypothetical protein|nr:hypothetical protein [Planctomycetaceae bacterium]
MRILQLGLIFFILSFVSIFSTNICANELKKILIAMDDSRESLYSGLCRLHGKTIQKTPDGTIIKEVNDECVIAFDYVKRNYRFDKVGVGKYLRNSEFQFVALEQKGVSTTISRYPLTEAVSTLVYPFDIRAIGFFSLYGNPSQIRYWHWGQLTENTKYKLFISQDGVFSKISLLPSDPNPQILPEHSTITVWLDPRNDYVTTKIDTGGFQISELSWKKVNGINVPVAFSGKYGLNNLPIQIEADWTFDWEIVNNLVPDHFFKVENFVSEGEIGEIVSWELGSDQPIRIARLDNTGTISEIPSRSLAGLRAILIITGLILIFISLCKMAYDRWKKKH